MGGEPAPVVSHRADAVCATAPAPTVESAAALSSAMDTVRPAPNLPAARHEHRASVDDLHTRIGPAMLSMLAKRTGSTVVVLAASVGALPEASDYISMFDRNVAALLAATALR